MARSKDDPLKQALSFEKPVVELDIKLKQLADEVAEKGDDVPAELLAEIETLEAERDERLRAMQSELSVWQRIQLSRHAQRPVTVDYTEALLTDMVELHGDRTYGDDQAIQCALATMGERKLMLIAHRKGRTTKERIACNWGCAHPEGYRKAQRAMKLAERLGLPVLTLINTPGAYPGLEAEERGQAGAIAWSILEMSALRVPIISVVIGEGGSGGALGIGVCDRLLILENSYYSVITPEGCASILWKDGSLAEEAANALKLSTASLSELGVADEILPEPLGGAHRDKAVTAETLRAAVERHFEELSVLSPEELLSARRAKYRNLGQYGEAPRPRRR